MQASSSSPSPAACRELLRAMPAMSAFRRLVYGVAPAECAGWLGTLSVVARHDGIRLSAVAELLRIDLSVASRAAATLEQLGYVARERDADDGRAWLLRATPSGAEWITSFGDEFADTLAARLDGWSDADVTSLAALLDRFDATLEETTP